MVLMQELQGFFSKYRFKPNKKLGQNFLVNEQAIQALIQAAELKPEDTVLEIGAGTGFITRELQKHCKTIAVELDENLFELLMQELSKTNLQLLQGSFLELEMPAFNKIVSAPPYNYSSPLMHWLFKQEFELAVLLLQKEFVEKLLSLPGFKERTSLSVLTAFNYNPIVISTVNASSFFPKPPSDSVILKLSREKRFGIVKNFASFEFFVCQLFRYKNKNLSNAFSHCLKDFSELFKTPKEKLKEKLEPCNFKNKKVYLLECKQFVELYNSLKV